MEILELISVSLEQRKKLWRNFDDVESAKEKRVSLALECLKKIICEQREGEEFLFVNTEIKRFTELLQSRKTEQEYETVFEKINSLCDEEIAITDSFCVGYLQQAIKHLVQIVEGDEPLIAQEYETEISDEDLEIDELDTAYCISVIWKYQNMCLTEKERKKLEKEYWIWYVKEAATIQGIKIKYEEASQDEAINEVEERKNSTVESLEEFVKEIYCDYEYISGEKKDNIITLDVLNLNDNNVCPGCGQASTQFAPFLGMMKIGQIKKWKIQLKIKEKLYSCNNSLCDEKVFFPKNKADYKERVAHFTYLKRNLENQKNLCEIFENL